MHPILKNRQILNGYLITWVPIGLMLAFALKGASHLPWAGVFSIIAPLALALAIVSLSAWFVCRSLDLRTTPDWKLAVVFLLASMCASTVVMGFGHVVVWLLGHIFPGLAQRFEPAIPVLAGMFSLIYLLSILLHYLVLAFESSQRAEILSREAELKALKAQVNPHFLFNSLNSISALTTVNPAAARQMCVALSDFLRSSLRLGERASIQLEEELALSRSYLEVERVRFGSKLRVREELADGCAECDVPPLLVQPLIENAIKHGIANLAEGGEIAIVGRRLQNQLRVVVENPFDPDAPPAQKTGFGLLGVRNRVQARYGTAGALEIDVQPALYRVTLSLPWICTHAREQERSLA